MIDPLVLPFPPSGNTYYRSIRMGQSCRVLISKRGREYKQQVSDMIEAIDDAVPVGAVAYGPEAIDRIHAIFA